MITIVTNGISSSETAPEIGNTWSVVKRISASNTSLASAHPPRPFSVARRLPNNNIDWLRDARGRIRTYADRDAAVKAIAALHAPD